MKKILSQRGSVLLVQDNFTFRRVPISKSAIEERWRCTKNCCPAKLFTLDNGETFSRAENTHNHSALEDPILYRKTVSNMLKRKALEDLTERPSKLIQQVIQKGAKADKVLTRKDINLIKGNIYREKVRKRVELPESIKVQENVEGVKIQDSSEDLILLRRDDMNGISVYSNNTNLTYLCQSEDILLDGKLENVLENSILRFTMYGYFNSNFVSLVWCHLNIVDKKNENYLNAIKLVQEECSQRNLELLPKNVMINDHGEKILRSVSTLFPRATIEICRIHSGKAWRRKKEVESTACETASGQDDSSSLPLPEQDAVPGPSTSGRNIETVVVKEERVKEELDIEDYGDPSDFLEFQTHEGVEGVRNVGENTGAVLAKPSSSGGAGGPFETIICGGDVQIKQEVFEDERDCFNSGMEVDPTLPWPAPSTTGIAEPLSSVTPTCGPPTNFYHVPSSSGTTSQVHPPPKKMKQRVKSNILRSQQMLKAVPSLSLEKCKICTEVFSSPSDLVEHCILRHSDASSKFLPTAEPSIPEHLKPAETFGMIPPTTSGFSAATPPAFSAATTPGFSATTTPGFSATTTSGFSAATTPGFSAATTPELNVANPPGQPPQNWIPPYISACDVFDGVFVSLRNIPVENRKATRDKILELVNFLSKEKVNPSTVSFSVEEK